MRCAGLAGIVAFAMTMPLTGCTSGDRRQTGPVTVAAPMSVVASFYPLAYAAKAVGGDLVRVTDLTPPGAEPHDLELTSDQVDEIEDARVVVEMGRGFQPSVERAAASRRGGTLAVLEPLRVEKGNVAGE